jgi:hypothetical protein
VVRAILFEPDWLFLDEGTASLDEPAVRMVCMLMRERLPRTTIVSVAHRSTLKALHSRSIDVGQLHAYEVVPSKSLRSASACCGLANTSSSSNAGAEGPPMNECDPAIAGEVTPLCSIRLV